MRDLVPASLQARMNSWRNSAEEWTPRPEQALSLKLMLTSGQCGLLLDPGMGKTSVTLAAQKILSAKKYVKRVLIVAPLRPVYEVWPEEISKWKDFHEARLAILHGSKKEQILRDLTPQHKIVCINPEGLDWLFSDKKHWDLLGADMLVIDESSKFKNTNTVRFRRLKKQLRRFARRYILTGSPRPKNYEDLFGQIYIIDCGIALGQYITEYRTDYFYQTGFEMREWALLPGSDKKINAAIAPLVLRMDAEDYLKLPGTPIQNHYVELPPAAQREYDSIEDKMLSTLFDSPMVTAAAARAKLCQMANGGVYTDSLDPDSPDWRGRERPYKLVHSAKVDALCDLYEELQGEPLMAAIWYHHDVAAIRKALGKNIPCINGQTTRTEEGRIIDAWNAGDIPLLLGQPASMGHGLNMQKCHARHVAYFNIPDDYDLYDQFFRRVRRNGNKSSFVMRHHFIARNTVDEAKMRMLKVKGSGQKSFLDAMRDYARKKYGKAV